MREKARVLQSRIVEEEQALSCDCCVNAHSRVYLLSEASYPVRTEKSRQQPNPTLNAILTPMRVPLPAPPATA